MRLDSLKLFKTPLKPDYSNVFDNCAFNQYEIFLIRNYDHLLLGQALVARRISSLDISVVVPYQYVDVKDYNYAISNGKAYFITSYESLNDSDINPSTKITLHYDCFINNLNKLNNTDYNDNMLIAQRHIDDTYIEDDTLYNGVFIPENEQVPIHESAVNNLKLLWYRLTFKKNIKKSPFTVDANTTKFVGRGVNSNDSVIVAYIPCCVVNQVGGAIKINSVYTQCTMYDSNGTSVDRKLLIDGKINPLYIENEDCISCELTYYAPINYTLNYNTGFVILDITAFGCFLYAENITETGPHFENSIIKESTDKTFIAQALYRGVPCIVYKSQSYSDTDANFSIDMRFSFPRTIVVNPLRSTSPTSNQIYESSLHKYPYEYKKVYINGEAVDCIPKLDGNRKQTFYVQIDCVSNQHSYARAIINDDTVKYIALQSNGELVTSVDSRDYYIRNNGNKITNRMLWSAVDSLKVFRTRKKFTPKTKKLTKNYKEKLTDSSLGMARTATNEISNLKDAENASDTYNIPSLYATDDLLQDLVYSTECRIDNDYDLENVYYTLHYIGDVYNRISSLRENTHKTFDFVQTDGCDLYFITNDEERSELENAYNNGITRWHIDDDNKEIGQNFSWFNRKLINLSNTQYSYYGGNT